MSKHDLLQLTLLFSAQGTLGAILIAIGYKTVVPDRVKSLFLVSANGLVASIVGLILF